MTATSTVSGSALPNSEEALELLEYLIDRLKQESINTLFGRTSDRVRSVWSYGIAHDFFNYTGKRERYGRRARAFLFHTDSTTKEPDVRRHLLLLNDTSWLTWDQSATTGLTISTMHYRTPELHDVFISSGLQGELAINCIRELLRRVDRSVGWSTDWQKLSRQIRRKYHVLG